MKWKDDVEKLTAVLAIGVILLAIGVIVYVSRNNGLLLDLLK
jgi:uncharacterized membrane protein YczE